MLRGRTLIKIIGTGMTPVGKLKMDVSQLMAQAFEAALGRARLTVHDVNGMVRVQCASVVYGLCVRRS